MNEARLYELIEEHDSLLQDMRLVRELHLPQCYIAAGYIRNYVWDKLHGYPDRKLHDDIDVVYFDTENATEARDRDLERKLIKWTGNNKWSVKNQARMHLHDSVAPYASTYDALSHWPEVVTAIGACLNDDDQLESSCPYGLEDLFSLRVRRSPLFLDKQVYLNRIASKDWLHKWPLLSIVSE